MKQSQVTTDPHLFRPLKRAMAGLAFLLLACSLWMPAPLQGPADVERVPNPVKAAWFLVWVQELVSYSTLCLYAVIVLGLLFFFIPFLPGVRRAEQASWLPADQRTVNWLTLGVFATILLLTLVALCFRGEHWQFDFVY